MYYRPMESLAGFKSKLRGVYYGWWVLAASAVLGLFTSGIFAHSNAVFFRPIKQDLNLSSTQASVIFSLSRVTEGITAPLIGPPIDRMGARPMIILGAIVASAGLVALHWVEGYLNFLLIFVLVVSLGRSAGFGQSLMTAVNTWFIGRRALAVSLLSIGFAMGGLAVVPLVTLGVHTIGWRDVMLYAGIFVPIVAISLATVIRRSPESMGIEPEGMGRRGAQRTSPDGSPETNASALDYSVREALSTSAFWILITATTLKLTIHSAIMVHAVEIMVWKGVDEKTAGFLFSFIFLVSVVVRLVMGILSVRFSVQPLISVGLVVGAVGTILLLLLDGNLAVFLFVALVPVDHGISPLIWASFGDFFGRRSYSTLIGILHSFMNIGMVISPIYAGWVFDKTDSYTLVLVTFVPFYAVSALLFLTLHRPTLRQRDQLARRAERA